MALAGGGFISETKVIPGAYINFVSASHAGEAFSERGVAAVILPHPWNKGNLVRINRETFLQDAPKLFGLSANASELLPIREMLCSANEVLVYLAGDSTYAEVEGLCRAAKKGGFGNDIRVCVRKNIAWTESAPVWDVSTYMRDVLIDRQDCVGGTFPLQNNEVVTFDENAVLTEGDFYLTGAMEIPATIEHVQRGLDALESEQFHTLACGFSDPAIKELFCRYTKRMRDECGVKFQCVVHDFAGAHEGIVNVKSDLGLVYWVAGALAGCPVNESLTNAEYTGEWELSPRMTQTELAAAVSNGEFVFHRVGNSVRVLVDCNTKGGTLGSNQTVRVLDQIANDIALTFREHFLGKVQNNASGRMSFWNAVVRQHKTLESLGAIEAFTADDVTVRVGSDKTAVVVEDRITPIGCMAKLYMTVTVL